MDSPLEQIVDHERLVSAIKAELPLLERFAEVVVTCIRGGGRIYLCGNGGSAADAQHIAAELVGRFRRNRKALPAIALTTDTSVLTAVSNDLGAEFCFSRQVEGLVRRGDILWALSTSGRSANILRAAEAAKSMGAVRLGFTGRNGEPLKRMCDHCLVVDHDRSDRIQEMHQLAYHLICDRVEREFANE